jgi:UDPglucose 6-dehydrogenase
MDWRLPALERGYFRRVAVRLECSTSVSSAVEESVGTPQSETGEADLSYVEAVAREMGPAIQEPKVIVEKSTVPVKTAGSLRRTLLLSGARPGTFSVVSNPEVLREGTAVTDFVYPDRIVVGAETK